MPAKKKDLPTDVIVKKYKSGQSMRSIADCYGVSYTPIKKRLKERDVNIRTASGRDEKRDFEQHKSEWKRLYLESGLSGVEIAERYDTSPTTVYRKFDDWGIERRSISESRRHKIWEKKNEVIGTYTDSDLTISEVAEQFDCGSHVIYEVLKAAGVDTTQEYPTGEDHPRWNGGYDNHQTKKWKTVRKKRIEKDGEECVVCGITREEHREKYGWDIEVHHIQPLAHFDNPQNAHKIDNTITLCRRCHNKWEGIPLNPKHE